ncbi:hypothetical protein GVAV_001265 [Gurleya vavrai]
MIFIFILSVFTFPYNHVVNRTFYVPSYKSSINNSNSYVPFNYGRVIPQTRIVISPLERNEVYMNGKDDIYMSGKEYRDYEESSEGEDSKPGMFKRMKDSLKDIFGGFSLMKVIIFVILMFLALAVGYQIRKGEEQSNYVRLPATQ